LYSNCAYRQIPFKITKDDPESKYSFLLIEINWVGQECRRIVCIYLAGLPDDIGIFKPKKHFGQILECLVMENIGILYGHLVIFTSFWRILWPFSTVCGHLVHLWSFGTFVVIWYICGHLVHLWSFGTSVVIWYICGHLVHLWSFGTFVVIWYICGHLVHLWSFGTFSGHLVYFPEKSGSPGV
jgi:hypothetical protein